MQNFKVIQENLRKEVAGPQSPQSYAAVQYSTREQNPRFPLDFAFLIAPNLESQSH